MEEPNDAYTSSANLRDAHLHKEAVDVTLGGRHISLVLVEMKRVYVLTEAANELSKLATNCIDLRPFQRIFFSKFQMKSNNLSWPYSIDSFCSR